MIFPPSAATQPAHIEPSTRGQPDPTEVEEATESATPSSLSNDPVEPEIFAEETQMTETHSRVVLPFSLSDRMQKAQFSYVSKTVEEDRFAHVSKPDLPTHFAHVGKIAEPLDFSTLWGASANPVWRPRKFIRDDSYPSVAATGFYFRKDSGGFALIRRDGRKYVSFYTKEAIRELEEQHGNKDRKTKRSAKRSRTGRRRDG